MQSQKSVSDYINSLPDSQKQICQILRKIIKKALPNIEEKMFGGAACYQNRAYIVGLKDHVNLGVSLNGLTKKQLSVLDSTAKLTGHIKIFTKEDIDEEKIITILKKTKPYC